MKRTRFVEAVVAEGFDHAPLEVPASVVQRAALNSERNFFVRLELRGQLLCVPIALGLTPAPSYFLERLASRPAALGVARRTILPRRLQEKIPHRISEFIGLLGLEPMTRASPDQPVRYAVPFAETRSLRRSHKTRGSFMMLGVLS
jgi:hypothetical protein